MGAMPVATTSWSVAPSNNVLFTSALRLVASGTQIASQPICSISAAASLARDHGWRSSAKVHKPNRPRGGGSASVSGSVMATNRSSEDASGRDRLA